MTPMTMSTPPAMFRLKTEVFVVTAKARIAPMAITASPVPVFMTVLPLFCTARDRQAIPAVAVVALEQLAPAGGPGPG